MKVVAGYDHLTFPPTLTLNVHGCPHKRQHREVLMMFREEINEAMRIAVADHRAFLPIDWPIDLIVFLVNPNSPDLDHLLEAIYMAVDGKTLDGPSILTDDRLIQSVKISKFYPNEPTKRDSSNR